MMKTNQKAFLLKHRINLKDYLKKNYQLVFEDEICTTNPNLVINNENEWKRLDLQTGETNQYGIRNNSGDILDWEALESKVSLTSALPIVEEKSKGLPEYNTKYYKDIKRLIQQILTRFNIKLQLDNDGKKYIESRGINSKLLIDNLAGMPICYRRLIDSFRNHPIDQNDLRLMLEAIGISNRQHNKYYLPYDPSVTMPIFDEDSVFQGFHGRRLDPGTKCRYFSTWYLVNTASSLFLGGPLKDLKHAPYIILTKGIFDYFACLTHRFGCVLATLNQGISPMQFDRLMGLECKDIIVGWDSEESRSTVSAMMLLSLKKKNLRFTDTDESLDTIVTNSKIFQKTIQNAVQKSYVTRKSINSVARRKVNATLKQLTNEGKTFSVKSSDIFLHLEDSKGTHQILKRFLMSESIKGNTQIKPGINYVRFPMTFIQDNTMSKLNAELRTLLFLLAKKPGNNPCRYNKLNLASNLSLTSRTLDLHIQLLINQKLLIKEIERFGNKVVHDLYPSTIPYYI